MIIQKETIALHIRINGCMVPTQGLHVRVSEAGHLQILLCFHRVGNSGHQTHGRTCLEENNAGKHAELWVENLVHVELENQILDLIQRRKINF